MRRSDAPTDTELAAYFAGPISAARAAEIDAWIAEDAANAARAKAVRLLLTAPIPAAEWDRDRIWSTIQHRIDRDESPRRIPAAPVLRTRVESPKPAARERLVAGLGARMLWIAAVAIIAIGFGAQYVRHARSSDGAHQAVATQSAPHDYVTARGMRVTVQLSDGSQVTLAPESRLRVAADFGLHERRVELEGEGEFDVVHDSTKPFSVRAGRAIVMDIGTRFDLRAYATDSSPRVAVAEGAVTLGAYTPRAQQVGGARPEGVLVRKGEVGQLDAAGRAVTANISTEAMYFGWTTGHLVFEREPLHDVVGAIARWYDVTVTVPDTAVANRLVTAQFSTQSPADMIRALAQAVNASVVGSGRAFTLRPK